MPTSAAPEALRAKKEVLATLRNTSRNIFGRRDWTDVQSVLFARIWKKFPRARGDDIDDAVALAMVDLIDYWIHLSSSIVTGNPDKTFWQACKRGTWMATTFLTQEWDTKDVPVESVTDAMTASPADDTPVEDEVLDHLERERFTNLVHDQLGPLGDWLRPFLGGVTTREQAAIEGVSQSAIAQRWGGRMTSFVEAAAAAGLVSVS